MIDQPGQPEKTTPYASSEMSVECGRIFFDAFENERGRRLRITRLNLKGQRQWVTVNAESFDAFLGHLLQHRNHITQ